MSVCLNCCLGNFYNQTCLWMQNLQAREKIWVLKRSALSVCSWGVLVGMEVNISRGGKKRLTASVEMQSLNPSDIWHVYLLWFIHICVQISANGEELEWRLESKALKPLTGSEIGGLAVFSMRLMLFSLVKWKTLMPLVCVIGYLYIPYWHLYHTSRITFALYMYDRTSRLEEGSGGGVTG